MMKKDFTQTCSEYFYADQQSFQLLSEKVTLLFLLPFQHVMTFTLVAYLVKNIN